MTSIALAGVTKVFAATSGNGGSPVRALDGIDLTIHSGERLGIIGRNGAGKSTLLQVIAGLTDVTSGSVIVQGHVTAIMTLGLGLRDQVTGRENIYLDGELQGKSRAEVDGVIDEVIAFSELGDFIDRPVRTYSTGMKARLAFSMLCHIDPEILIVDEALSVGDASFSRKATDKIREICNRGKIVILVSHSMASVKEMCNRCIWLESGRVVAAGPPHEVADRYLQSVRQADDQAALERFSKLAGEWSYRHGWRIGAGLRQGGDESQRLVESGEPLTIQVDGVLAAPAGAAVTVSIVRLDGVRMFSYHVDALQHVDASGRLQMTLRLDPLVLGAAIYRADITAVTEAQPAARCSVVFEVYSKATHSGGRPMLDYPMHIEITRVR